MSALLFAVVAVAPAVARDLVWAGHLEEGGVPVDRTVSLTATFTDDDGDAVGAFEDAVLLLVDGNFVFDFLLEEGVRPYHARILINGSDFGDQVFDDTWPVAAFADSADEAARAVSADSGVRSGFPGFIPARTADFTAGNLPITFANIADVPAPFADGDQGIDLTASARFTFVGDTIALADGSIDASRRSGQLVRADFATGAVATVDLQNDGLENADFAGTIPLTALAPNTLRAANFSAAQNSTTLFRITAAGCIDIGALSADSTCRNGRCRNAAGDILFASCDGVCGGVAAETSCPNTAVGNLVFK